MSGKLNIMELELSITDLDNGGFCVSRRLSIVDIEYCVTCVSRNLSDSPEINVMFA